MAAVGKPLAKNISATGNLPGVSFRGGRLALVIIGTLATTTQLQLLGQDGTTWIPIFTPATAGVYVFDAPAGEYRLSLVGGAPAAVYADIVSIPYN